MGDIFLNILFCFGRYLQRPLSKTKTEYYFFNTYFFGKLVEASSSSKVSFIVPYSRAKFLKASEILHIYIIIKT